MEGRSNFSFPMSYETAILIIGVQGLYQYQAAIPYHNILCKTENENPLDRKFLRQILRQIIVSVIFLNLTKERSYIKEDPHPIIHSPGSTNFISIEQTTVPGPPQGSRHNVPIAIIYVPQAKKNHCQTRYKGNHAV